jgi:hypothetical protein
MEDPGSNDGQNSGQARSRLGGSGRQLRQSAVGVSHSYGWFASLDVPPMNMLWFGRT